MNELLLIGIATVLMAASPIKDPEPQIRAFMLEQQNSWNNGDIEGFMNHYWNDPDMKFVSKKGVTMGWENTLANYKRAYPTEEDMGQLVFELEEVRPLGKGRVFVIGSWLIERHKLDVLEGYFTLLWEKKNGRWVITVDHTS